MVRPGRIASRTVSQYRSRDVFTYLALRYFLEAEIAASDEYVMKICPQIVRGYNHSSYLRSRIFKDFDDVGAVEHREFFVPAAAEALAESVLLESLSEHVDFPDRQVCFSYWFAPRGSRKYLFMPYMKGLRARQDAIGNYLRENPGSIVQYLDIKKFYPSISLELVERQWRIMAEECKLPESMCLLGQKLIDKQKRTSPNGGIIIGPMFSHFLANLVLRDVDQELKRLSCLALRYVDDFVLVGEHREVSQAAEKIQSSLDQLGLELHSPSDPKSITVDSETWLDSQSDFESGPISDGWMKLVGDIKKVLILEIEDESSLSDALQGSGCRLPVADYSAANAEATTFEKIKELGIWGWLFRRSKGVNASSIVRDAVSLREEVEKQLQRMLVDTPPRGGFERKRLITKLRYRIGRALYLSDEHFLAKILPMLEDWEELAVHREIIRALITKECDEVVRLGANVSQSTAQLFRASLETAFFRKPVTEEVQQLGLSIFALNGVPIDLAELKQSRILNSALGPIDRPSDDTRDHFLDEFASLHGPGEPRHPQILRTAFDISNDLSFDAMSFEYGYSI